MKGKYILIALLIVVVGVLTFLFIQNREDEVIDNHQTTEKEGDFESIEVLFDETQFEYANSVELLREINICTTAKQDSLGYYQTPCSPELFKFFPLKKGKDIHDGFILLIKANTGGIPVRRVLIFERENGALIKTNGFLGDLAGRRESKSNHDDLLVRFIEKYENSDYYHNCLFQWENGKYEFKSVELIQQPSQNYSGIVEADVKDSVSKEIYQMLLDKKQIF